MRKLLLIDPEFAPSSEHTAHAVVSNNTAKAWTYDIELYLIKDSVQYASSGFVAITLDAGASGTVDCPIIMPDTEGTYKVYLDVYVSGEFIKGYQALEDITVTAPAGVAGDFEYNNLNLAIHSIPDEPYGRWSEVSCDIKNVSDYTLTMEVAVWLQAGYYWYEFIKQTHDSFYGWTPGYAPPGTWNAGTINLTLAPGETFHFHYGGTAAYNDFNDVYLEDSAGGKSNTVRAYG